MQHIDRDRTPSTRARPTPRRRLARGVVLLPLVSMALAGALIVTLSGGDDTSAPATRAAGAHSASAVLDRIAVAAMATDATPVKDGQFVYVESLTRSNEGTFDGRVRLGALHKREVWMSQDPGPVTHTGWIRDSGKGAVMPGQLVPIESADPVPAGIHHPTYKWLASLPTDPDALLALLYAQTRVDEGESKEQAVFSKIGHLVSETIMPSANASALYGSPPTRCSRPAPSWSARSSTSAARHPQEPTADLRPGDSRHPLHDKPPGQGPGGGLPGGAGVSW